MVVGLAYISGGHMWDLVYISGGHIWGLVYISGGHTIKCLLQCPPFIIGIMGGKNQADWVDS